MLLFILVNVWNWEILDLIFIIISTTNQLITFNILINEKLVVLKRRNWDLIDRYVYDISKACKNIRTYFDVFWGIAGDSSELWGSLWLHCPLYEDKMKLFLQVSISLSSWFSRIWAGTPKQSAQWLIVMLMEDRTYSL